MPKKNYSPYDCKNDHDYAKILGKLMMEIEEKLKEIQRVSDIYLKNVMHEVDTNEYSNKQVG